MRKTIEDLCRSLQDALAKSSCNPRQKKSVEACFFNSLIHWENVKEIVANEGFPNEAAEIQFFKTTKHLFTSEIEYYSLLYFALVFAPNPESEHHTPFWVKEGERLCQLKQNHKDLLMYQESGKSDSDHLLFLRKNRNESLMEQFKIKEDERSFSTGYDYFFTMLKALERYNKFVAEASGRYRI